MMGYRSDLEAAQGTNHEGGRHWMMLEVLIRMDQQERSGILDMARKIHDMVYFSGPPVLPYLLPLPNSNTTPLHNPFSSHRT